MARPSGGSASFGVPGGIPGVYYLQVFSATPNPPLSVPVPGSTVIGDYRLTNIRGVDGAIVRGTAVPEPSSIMLGLAFTGSGLWFKRRSKKGNQ